MPYCEGKNLAFVRFKYPDGDWQQVKSRHLPVDYSLVEVDPPFQGGQCLTTYYISYQRASISNGDLAGWSSVTNDSSYPLVGPIKDIRLFVNGVMDEDLSHWSFKGKGEDPFKQDRSKVYKFEVQDAQGLKAVHLGLHNGLRFVFFRRQDNQPDNCGNLPGGGCVFKIIDVGGEIYSRTEDQCPTVNVRCGEQCPPGTCECGRGSLVCCYSPKTGQVVKSFRR